MCWPGFAATGVASVAVEFALVAPLFFCMLFAILETAIIFFASQVLENATQESARLILTRQAQNTGMTEADFKTQSVRPHQGDVQLPRQSRQSYR